MKLSLLNLICILFVLSSCDDSSNTSSNTSNTSNTSTGTTTTLTTIALTHDSVAREYLRYVPTSYDANTATAVLFLFHGFGGQASDFVNTADFRSLADSETFIVIYPQGSLLNGDSGATHWNNSMPAADNKSSADDFGFFAAMIADLASNYNIDRARVYAAGYSNGGFFSYALACFHSNLVAGVAIAAGTMIDDAYSGCAPTHQTAIVHLHGTADTVVPYNGNNMGNTAVDAIVTYWQNYNSLDSTPTITTGTANGLAVELATYAKPSVAAEVLRFKITNGGHIWFDFNFNGSSTHQIIWDTLSQFSTNGRL